MSVRRVANKDVKRAIELLAREDWRYDGFSTSGHVRMLHATGRIAYLPGTPSDHRSLKNAISQLRRKVR